MITRRDPEKLALIRRRIGEYPEILESARIAAEMRRSVLVRRGLVRVAGVVLSGILLFTLLGIGFLLPGEASLWVILALLTAQTAAAIAIPFLAASAISDMILRNAESGIVPLIIGKLAPAFGIESELDSEEIALEIVSDPWTIIAAA